MAEHYHRIIRQLAVLQDRVANIVRVGKVHEVKKDKMRMVLGQDKDGKDVLGPWLHTGNTMRGGARERRFFKKGQNLAFVSPNGDPRQAAILPYAPNNNFPAPDHANDTGQDEEVWQLDDLRVRKKKEGYEIWLQAPKKNQQQGQTQSGTGTMQLVSAAQQQQESKDNAEVRVKLFLHNDHITGRMGTKVRFMACEQGAKFRAQSQWAVVTPSQLIVSKPWKIGQDPLKNYDD